MMIFVVSLVVSLVVAAFLAGFVLGRTIGLVILPLSKRDTTAGYMQISNPVFDGVGLISSVCVRSDDV